MPHQDRTEEFFAAVDSIRTRRQTGERLVSMPSSTSVSTSQPMKKGTDFATVSQKINNEIHKTKSKLERLSTLVASTSLFEDNSAEIQELTHTIKEKLGELNREILKLQEISKNPKLLQGGEDLHAHAHQVILVLQSKLAQISSSFKDTLTSRTQTIQTLKDRQLQHFSMATPSEPLIQRDSALYKLTPTPRQSSTDHIAIDMADEISQPKQDLMLAPMYESESGILENRSRAITDIESTITELASIFQQLAMMVSEQREQVQRIDANLEEFQINVDAGQNELLKYLRSISSNRWLVVKIFAVLLIFFVLFVAIV